jgi:nitrite reductase/ring-hydroxylating ferredoxin subunit
MSKEPEQVAQEDSFIEVAKVNDVPDASMIGVTVNGKQILIARMENKYYAIDAICSHYFGFLPKGKLKDNRVVCPVHKAEFDLNTRKVAKDVTALLRLATRRRATDLKAYEVKVVDNKILIRA